MSVFDGKGGRIERDNILNCKFKQLDALVRWHPSHFSTRLQIEEV